MKIVYWISTGLLTALCLLGSFLDLTHAADAVALITHLGYPIYFVTLIGVARLLGVIGILVPGFARVKEWAYAGLFFDMVGALYSHIATGDPVSVFAPAIVGLVLVIGSYATYHKLHQEQ